MTDTTNSTIHIDNENLRVYIDEISDDHSSVKQVQTCATFGADNTFSVDTCDGRPESTYEGKPERTAVRLRVHSDHYGDDDYQRVSTTVAMTATEALRLAQSLIAQATGLI